MHNSNRGIQGMAPSSEGLGSKPSVMDWVLVFPKSVCWSPNSGCGGPVGGD